ncbi:putative dsRNA-binding protein [Methanosalsum natronophilum]|uniref:putative dsRNA-binding protein n=1 Tax=Methanosalsum natronophilum TaxID=768733 RepID=UPI00216A89CC|nr:putative dsRNA-binding protein [Methanosalsum natronophilum]MCS3924320.1 dsRNA-specific ribonuclease [Methanosalsum natronophilum]
MIAAIYLDQGFERANKFIETFFLSDLDDYLKKYSEHPIKSKRDENPKGYLQEQCQKHGYGIPSYSKECEKTGEDHSPKYATYVEIKKKKYKGTGDSKKNAEDDAAENANKELFDES